MVRPSLLSRLIGRLRGEHDVPQAAAAGAGRLSAASPLDRVAIAEPTKEFEKKPPGSITGNGRLGEKPAGKTDALKMEPLKVETLPTCEAPKAEAKAKKIGGQEELSLRIHEGLTTLSGLLGNIDQKLATQNRQNVELSQGLQKLPMVFEGLINVQKSQLDALQEIRETVQAQKGDLANSAERLAKLPELFDGLGTTLGEKLDKQTRSGEEVRDSVETVGKSVRGLADSSQRAQNTLLAEFRRAQDEHGRRLQDLVERERKSTIVVAALGFLVVVCLVLVLVTI
jgi:hypothetical protein